MAGNNRRTGPSVVMKKHVFHTTGSQQMAKRKLDTAHCEQKKESIA